MIILNRLGMIEGVETMRAQEERMSQIANNLANVDTPGFKRQQVTFWEMLHRTESGTNRVGKAHRDITDHLQGAAELTGGQLDMLIDGEGFFRVQTPEGIRYTRAGNFVTNSSGQLVTQDGYPVLGQAGTVTIDGSDVAVGPKGEVIVDGELVNQLQVVSFQDLNALQHQGKNLFRAGANTPETDAGNFRIVQGSLEQSNVNTAVEMTEMIDLQRAFQAQQKIIQTIDDIDGDAVNRVGKVVG